jgi:hypothetical protein
MSTRPSPLQNRVTPAGEIVAAKARGTLMGNRGGRLHEGFRLGRKRWASDQWIACKLSFRERHRKVMGEGYTELFFLDEATAMAAGHRPCFECRREAAEEFAGLWAEATGLPAPPRAPEMDAALHAERMAGPWKTPADALPVGAMFRHLGQSWLCFGFDALLWDHGGYCGRIAVPEGVVVEVFTPRTTCRVMAAGYRPAFHPSAIDALTA